MGICAWPRCEEWVNSAITVYCCELHKQYHRAESAEAKVEAVRKWHDLHAPKMGHDWRVYEPNMSDLLDILDGSESKEAPDSE